MDDQTTSAASVSPIRATLIVGLGSAFTLALSVVVTKVFALLIGPLGVGRLGLLQSTLNIATIAVGAGLSTTVVRRVAADRSGPAMPGRELAAILASVALGLVGVAVILFLREPIAAVVLGSHTYATEIAVIALALGLSVVSGVLIAVLTGRHEIRTVTVVAAAAGLAAAIVGIPLVALYGEAGLAPTLALTALAQLAFAGAVIHARISSLALQWSWLFQQAAGLIGEGIPIALSQLVGQGIQLGIPIVILHMLGAADVGFYRAAATVSVGYLTFFLATLTQDFYPRISATSGSHHVGIAVERRMRLLMGLGTPLIFAMLAASPLLIHLLYSSAFEPAVGLLRWQLTGDLLRLPAWVLGFVLLANGRMVRYFIVEVVSGAILLLGTVVATNLIGLEGAGAAYALTQAVHLLVLWIAVGDLAQTRPGRLQLGLVLLASASAVVISVGFPQILVGTLFGAAAIALAVTAWPRLLDLHRQQLLH